jgi:tetratricopeptide (TPR) repeat protein
MLVLLGLCLQVIKTEPGNANNFYKRFRVYLRQKKNKEALADLTSALELDPKHEQALAQRAKLNLRLGNCAESETDFISLQR